MTTHTAGICTSAATTIRPNWPLSPTCTALASPALTPTTRSSAAAPTRAIVRWLHAHVVRPTAVASTGSARSADSSERRRIAACTPNTAANTPANPSSTARNASLMTCSRRRAW